MFDRYREIAAPDSHADIIVWPIKALCDYVEATGDMSILDGRSPTRIVARWRSDDTRDDLRPHEATDRDDRARLHPRHLVPDLRRRRLGGHPPAGRSGMAQRLVSAWTVELAYQTLERYRRCASGRERDGGSSGRLLRPDALGLQPLPRPRRRRRRTGPLRAGRRRLPPPPTRPDHRRALPIAADDARDHQRHVQPRAGRPSCRAHRATPPVSRRRAADGPADGLPRWRLAPFQACRIRRRFGREVGLQYVHAHIRYIEAMARIGVPTRRSAAARGLPDQARPRRAVSPPAPEQRVLQQFRRRLRRSVPGEPPVRSDQEGRSGSRAAGASIRAGPASTSTS